ncbi:MAG: hypothetical protein SVM80_10275 [Halobacteriota archaeon]|nr:hypothetical protein [Halobacteriota archaeon]
MEFTGDYSHLKDYIESRVGPLAGYLRFSTIPLILELRLFEELCSYNVTILKAVAALYEGCEGAIYPHMEEDFVRRIEGLKDPPESITLARLDFMRNSKGSYVCFDLNTQPGTPGSIVWGACGFIEGGGMIDLKGGSMLSYSNVFPILSSYFRSRSNGLPKVALYESENSSLHNRLQDMLKRMCEVITGFGLFRYDFVRDEDDLQYYDIIEPFFNLNGDLDTVYSNYETAIESDKPLASNLKLAPYESKDFAFTELLDGMMSSEKIEGVKSCVAEEKEIGFVEKSLFGMSGSGFGGKISNNWPDRIVKQEALKPDVIDVSVDGEEMRMIYEIGITSLLHFKKRRLIDFLPCVDLTVKASTDHPISGPDTVVIPALVKR